MNTRSLQRRGSLYDSLHGLVYNLATPIITDLPDNLVVMLFTVQGLPYLPVISQTL